MTLQTQKKTVSPRWIAILFFSYEVLFTGLAGILLALVLYFIFDIKSGEDFDNSKIENFWFLLFPMGLLFQIVGLWKAANHVLKKYAIKQENISQILYTYLTILLILLLLQLRTQTTYSLLVFSIGIVVKTFLIRYLLKKRLAAS